MMPLASEAMVMTANHEPHESPGEYRLTSVKLAASLKLAATIGSLTPCVLFA